MLSRNEIYLLMRMIERNYHCHICIIDGRGNYLFSMNFPEIDTTHISPFCMWSGKRADLCRDCDSLSCQAHGERVFFKVCPYGCMEIAGSISLPGYPKFQVFCGPFKPRANLPPGSLVYSPHPHPLSETLRELSDEEFAQLPAIWEMLIRELSQMLEHSLIADRRTVDPKDIISDYINGHFRDPISLEKLSKKIGWTEAHTAVRIRKMFGKTFVQMLNERRVENVKWLLRNRYTHSISMYMKVSGFHSAPHFFRTFQRITGMTPTQYRNSVKGAKSAEGPPL